MFAVQNGSHLTGSLSPSVPVLLPTSHPDIRHYQLVSLKSRTAPFLAVPHLDPPSIQVKLENAPNY